MQKSIQVTFCQLQVNGIIQNGEEGEKSDRFSLEQGVAQGCSLSPILFSVFINNLLKRHGLGVQLNNGKTIGGLLFADDFVHGYE